MATTETDIWKELRKPFPEGSVGLLPKVSCYACTQATKTARSALDKHCPNHSMSKCGDCGNYITSGHIHLDYVGHAAVTDRLNSVDPTWTWEPAALDAQGSPTLDREGNLWIKLTVGNVTRLGVGDGSNMKERIGDALRNAAMRFGVALDLWTKDELESQVEAPELKNEKPSATKPATNKSADVSPTDHKPAAPAATVKPAPATTERPEKPVEAPEATLTVEQIGELMQIAKKKGHISKEDAFNFLNVQAMLTDFRQLPQAQYAGFKKLVLGAGWGKPADVEATE